MKSRTDFVSIGWMDQLRQAMYNQIKAMGALLWVLLGFTVGLGNMMMEISPFGAALCAAAPFRYLPAAALGSAAGSLLLSNLAELGGAHTLTIKYSGQQRRRCWHFLDCCCLRWHRCWHSPFPGTSW